MQKKKKSSKFEAHACDLLAFGLPLTPLLVDFFFFLD
jgi:hypothetical protein